VNLYVIAVTQLAGCVISVNLGAAFANSGLSLTIPSSGIVKCAGCNASDLRKLNTARSTFGRSGSIIEHGSR
jgi:hypothetical protein